MFLDTMETRKRKKLLSYALSMLSMGVLIVSLHLLVVYSEQNIVAYMFTTDIVKRNNSATVTFDKHNLVFIQPLMSTLLYTRDLRESGRPMFDKDENHIFKS